MKKSVWLLILGLLLIGFNMYANDGDLIVNGKIGVATTSPSGLLHLLDVDGTKGSFYYDRTSPDSVGPSLYLRKSKGSAAVQANDQLGRLLFSGYNGTAWVANAIVLKALAAENWTSSANGTSLSFVTISNGTTAQAERMRIASDGNIAIGTSSSGGYKLNVNGTISATNYVTNSDLRMKNNIKPINNALALVQGLQGVSFNWKTAEYQDKNLDKGKQIGLIAQDVEKVLPELVKTDTEGYKAIAYEKLTAVLVEALKEQQKEIQTLKAEVQKLKTKTQN